MESYDTEQSEEEAKKRKEVRAYLILMIRKFVKKYKAGKAKIPIAVELLNTVRQDIQNLQHEIQNMVDRKQEFTKQIVQVEEFQKNH